MALEAALVEKGVITTDAVDFFTDAMEHRFGPHHGARVVAKAWVDADFRRRLLDDANAAVAELGIGGLEGNIRVVENTPDTHNMVVCTLCSCYPWPLLGLPPIWYKSFAYRSRAVAEPRAVLAEFGVELNADVHVRVWDSSSEVRYLVLPGAIFSVAPRGISVEPPPPSVPPVQVIASVTVSVPPPSTVPPEKANRSIGTGPLITVVPAVTHTSPPPEKLVPVSNTFQP